MNRMWMAMKIFVLTIGLLLCGISVQDVYASDLLRIEAESIASAANNYGGVCVDIDLGEAVSDEMYYVVEKSTDLSIWKRIGLSFWYSKELEETTVKAVKVLNVYPDNESYSLPDNMSEGMSVQDYEYVKKLYQMPVGEFTFADGTKATLPKSASLKIWMEGGSYSDSKGTENFTNVSKYKNQKMISVDLMSMSDFNTNIKSVKDIYSYDVLFFGIWDANGWNDLSDRAKTVTEEFIKNRKGVIFGHDTIACQTKTEGIYTGDILLNNFFQLKEYMNLDSVPLKYKNSSVIKENANNLKLPTNYQIWGGSDTTGSVEVEFSRNKEAEQSFLTTFPNDLLLNRKVKVLNVPNTHTAWMQLQSDSQNVVSFSNNEYSLLPSAISTCYNNVPNRKFNWYLSSGDSKYVCYMIQTGHSRCRSLPDERKLIANVISNCCQQEQAKYIKENKLAKLDASAQDYEAPVVSKPRLSYDEDTEEVKILFAGIDYGSDYYFRARLVKGISGTIATSNIEAITVTTGIEKYYVIVDSNNANADFSIEEADDYKKKIAENGIVWDFTNVHNKYIHIKAVDYAGNVSKPVTFLLEDLMSIEMEPLLIEAEEAKYLYQSSDTNGIRTYYLNGNKSFSLQAACYVIPYATKNFQPERNSINNFKVTTEKDTQIRQHRKDYKVVGTIHNKLKVDAVSQVRKDDSSKLQLDVDLSFKDASDGLRIAFEPGGTSFFDGEERKAVLGNIHKIYLYCDLSGPVIKTNSFLQWYNADNINEAKTVKMECSDAGSGFSNYIVQLKRSDGLSENVLATKRGIKANTEVSFVNVSKDGLYEYTIIADDRVRNKTEKRIQFGVDKTAPVIEGVESCYGWTNENVEVEFEIKDELSGVKEVRLLDERQNLIISSNEDRLSYCFDEEQDTRYYVEAEDYAGNISTKMPFLVRIDKTKPYISGTGITEENLNVEGGREFYYLTENKICAHAGDVTDGAVSSGIKVLLLRDDREIVLWEKRQNSTVRESEYESLFYIEYEVRTSQESSLYSLAAIDYAGNVRKIFLIPPICMSNSLHRYIHHDNYEEKYGYYRLYE